MSLDRRRFLLAAGLFPVLSAARAATGRVLIVGGGWGGLAAAAHLRQLAPELEITLVDRQPAFVSFALSNRWLVDLAGSPGLLRQDYAAVAKARGYRFIQVEVQSIDRERRQAITAAGPLPYDWLVLAPGIREDFAAWQIDDPSAVDCIKQRFSSGLAHAAELVQLKARLAAFTGGDLLMSIPPMPYRCPPAPYERAMLIAWWLKTRKIPGRLIVIDPNPLMPAFRSILLDRFKAQITYLDHARIEQVDLARQTVMTEIDDIRFDEALLGPPQQAAGVLWSAGLIRPDANTGAPSGWAAQGALDFRSAVDERIFIIGDAVGLVSPLFGHYPKTGHVANRMGVIVAAGIAAAVTGRSYPALSAESVCHVLTSVEPSESVRIDTSYRDRGDGFLLQTVKQTREPNPRGEDVAWAEALYRDFLRP